MSHNIVQNLSGEEWILALLIAPATEDYAEDVVGSTRLVKELFLLKEEYHLPLPFTFVPYHHGPYSDQIFNAIREMRRNWLITVTTEETPFGNITYRYSLTQAGAQRAYKIFENLPQTVRQAITEMKGRFNSTDFMSLLSYVYRSYPYYAQGSNR